MIAPIEPKTGRIRISQNADVETRKRSSGAAKSAEFSTTTAESLQQHLNELIERHPVAVVATAAMIGLTLGWLTKRRGR